jgi:hypothetical protein
VNRTEWVIGIRDGEDHVYAKIPVSPCPICVHGESIRYHVDPPP